jgi:hypothetical protein
VRVRQPDWDYVSHGPYLVTRRWQDGRSETSPVDTLHAALHTALHWHTIDAHQAVAIIDGWGEFVFARSATHQHDPNQHAETKECTQLLWGDVSNPGGSASTALFSGIEPE